ncbi:LPS translocon maturation chaperone LptM [Pseudidiomarina planktonica]|nr:lipoprotein [Pseudidiomarina planktonica]
MIETSLAMFAKKVIYILLFLSASTLLGCGQTGPLHLPEERDSNDTTQRSETTPVAVEMSAS